MNYVKIQRIERFVNLKKETNKKNFICKKKLFNREKIEHSLIFLGLVIMENRLKPQTEGKRKISSIIYKIFFFLLLNIGVLKTLANANIRTIMCTGMFYFHSFFFLIENYF